MARNVQWDLASTVTTGDATYDSATGTYTLTPDLNSQAGLVSSATAYSVDYDFSFVYEAYYGDRDAGADGITWMFHNDPNGNVITPTTGGQYFGTDHVQNAFVLEYDTYQNAGDMANDHLQLRAQSDAGGTHDSSYLSSSQTQLTPSGNVEDDAWHLHEINWSAATRTLTVDFDGVRLAEYVFDAGDANGDGFSDSDLSTVLGGDRVYFAMGSATGGERNEHAVRSIDMEGTICFVRGTRIRTPMGDRPVQTLKPGDLVVTRDHGPRPIRWIGKTRAKALGKLAPIRFAKGAIGNYRPLMVSPQHRMVVSGWQAELMMGEADCLVSAVGLVNDKTVRPVRDGRDVEYWHILLDDHEILFANGAEAESLLAGKTALDSLSEAYREEILTLFPELEFETPLSALPMVPPSMARAFSLPHGAPTPACHPH